MIYLAIFNIFLAIIGVRRSFKTKSLIMFVWLIIFYYTITSLVSLIDNASFPLDIRMTYVVNMTLCLIAFLASDMVFNKKEKTPVDFRGLRGTELIIRVVEIIFWLSLLLTFFELRTQDYATYNSAEGHAGWAQTFFQITSCIICYFVYKKQWYKLIAAILLAVGMVASTSVRSLLYFILLPILLYYINSMFQRKEHAAKLLIRSIPIVVLVVIAVIVVNSLRFGKVELPETELTYISLNTMDHGGFPLQYFNSFLHYITHLFPPIINALNMFGLDVVSPAMLLPPSIPRLNDMYANIYSTGEAHMPGTIFHDFYMSFGYWGALWGFVVFSYLKLLCNFLQRNIVAFFSFCSVFGWHIYFLLRGACDSCMGGIAYSIWLALILYFIMKQFIKRRTV